MNGVNKTLYIPLYGKAYVSRKGILLEDKKAEAIWDEAGFPLAGKARSKWLAYYMGIRAAVFDDWLRQQLADDPESVVIHVGCGLDSRVLRTGIKHAMWYDVDLPEVIRERKRYFVESDHYRMIAADIRDARWMTEIPESRHAVIVMEGISMYLTNRDLRGFIKRLCDHFDQVWLLMDCYSGRAAKLSRYRNPINAVGVTSVWGVDDPTSLQYENFRFVQEHDMIPRQYTQVLQGMEKFIFTRLYAGRFARKLYRLYEYRKG